jgi:hypothetical protein
VKIISVIDVLSRSLMVIFLQSYFTNRLRSKRPLVVEVSRTGKKLSQTSGWETSASTNVIVDMWVHSMFACNWKGSSNFPQSLHAYVLKLVKYFSWVWVPLNMIYVARKLSMIEERRQDQNRLFRSGGHRNEGHSPPQNCPGFEFRWRCSNANFVAVVCVWAG